MRYEIFLCDNKVALRHRLRHVIPVLVFWKLDANTNTMHPLARNTRQDAETNDMSAQVPHGDTGRTHDSVVQTTAQQPEKHKNLTW